MHTQRHTHTHIYHVYTHHTYLCTCVTIHMPAYPWDHAKNKKNIAFSPRLFSPRPLGLVVSGSPMPELKKTMPY